MSRVSRKEDIFYRLFEDFGDKIAETADVFSKLVYGYPETSSLIAQMGNLEHECDSQVSAILTQLSQSFITPFDREDIDELARTLDGVPDNLEGVARRFDMFAVEDLRPEIREFADLMVKATGELNDLLHHLHDFKKDPIVREKIRSVSALEDEGDELYRNALARLFNEREDPFETIKWKSLFDKAETAIDCCKDSANVVQNVVMKNA